MHDLPDGLAKQIIIEHLFKVFAEEPATALELVRQGCSKSEILAKTGSSSRSP